MRKVAVLWAIALVAANVACDTRPHVTPEPAKVVPTGEGPRIVAAPAGDEPAGEIVKRVRTAESAKGRDVLVYVGAPWCEPCKRFHDALLAGKLDADFPNLTLIEFDHDRDELKLKDAGYTSRLIPLFAKPAPDGLASDASMSGSVKGDGAVAEITPRLRALIAAK